MNKVGLVHKISRETYNLIDNFLGVAIFLRSGLPPFERLDFACQLGVRFTVREGERLATSRGRTFEGTASVFEHLLDSGTRKGVFAHGSNSKFR